MKTSKICLKTLMPVLLSFFVMGFVDIVGISVSYVKVDFGLNDKLANLLPMMVFLWFAIFSLPVGRLMGRIGRRKTVLLSAAVTFVAMLLPMLNYSFPMMLIAFALLGIGNTILQVSLNPLLTDIVPQDKVTGMLAMGQFLKAIASTLGPIIISFLVGAFGSWKLIFPTYAVITLLSWLWLAFVRIDEKAAPEQTTSVASLFKDKYLMMLFTVIILSVGFEIGLMTAVPKYLHERFQMSLAQGGFACSLYYIARTVGTFAGSFLLTRIPVRKFQIWTMSAAVFFLAAFILLQQSWMILTALFIVGLACANIFAATLGEALRYKPSQANDISALMITGVAGGALIPPVMGVVADMSNQTASLLVPLLALVYILAVSFKIKK